MGKGGRRKKRIRLKRHWLTVIARHGGGQSLRGVLGSRHHDWAAVRGLAASDPGEFDAIRVESKVRASVCMLRACGRLIGAFHPTWIDCQKLACMHAACAQGQGSVHHQEPGLGWQPRQHCLQRARVLHRPHPGLPGLAAGEGKLPGMRDLHCVFCHARLTRTHTHTHTHSYHLLAPLVLARRSFLTTWPSMCAG